MSLFNSKEQRVIGVDVGTSSIKLVELAKRNDSAFELVTYGFVEQIERDVRGIGKESASTIAHAIKVICEKAGVTTAQTTAALPTYVVFTSLISLPKMSHDELDSAIHWEAKKIIPLPLEDIILDYKILNKEHPKGFSLPFAKKEEEKKNDETAEEEDLKVLITGAPKETVQVYTDIFEKSSLSLVSLETEMFALSRSLVGDDPGEIMVVEIGAAVTDIIIIQDGVPFLGRSIETGGNALTRAIMNSLNINEKRAEQLKRDIGVSTFSDQTGGGGIPLIVQQTLEPVLHEIRYTLDMYKSHIVTPSAKATGSIEKIILTGGSSLLPNLVSYLTSQLDMRVFLGDPWAHINYPDDLKPVLAGIGPKFSVAVGLAMRAL